MTTSKPTIKVPKFLEQAYKDQSDTVAIKAGRRTGKTYNFALWLIQEMDSLPNQQGLWVDTAYGNIQKYMDRYFQPILTQMNLWSYCSWNVQRKILTLHNGSTIDFGSADRPELLEGFGYKRAVLNEAGIIAKKRGLFDNTLFPMLKGAKTRIISTPKGNNRFKELYHANTHYSFTAYDSPFWTEEQIEEARRSMTQEAFRQEIMAEFIEGAGAVFRNIQANISGALLNKPKDGRRYVLACDLAKHQDFTVIMIGDTVDKQIVHFERFNQIDWGLQKSRIVSAYRKFNCKGGIVDATGVGDSIFDDLRASGLNVEGFKFTPSSKQEIISNLSVAMDNQEINYPNIESLIGELEVFAYEQRGDGSFRYSAPEGLHDDCVVTLSMINKLFNVKPIQRSYEVT